LLLEVYVTIGWFKTFEIKRKNRRLSFFFGHSFKNAKEKRLSLQKGYTQNKQPFTGVNLFLQLPKPQSYLFMLYASRYNIVLEPEPDL
jgi:hypothetical protein